LPFFIFIRKPRISLIGDDMNKFGHQFAASKLAALFGRAPRSGHYVDVAVPEELTAAEIAFIAGGPEGEVGTGLSPPQ
jgi:hypothetical protein